MGDLKKRERLKDSNFRLRKRDSNVYRAALNVLMIAGFVIFATAGGPHLHRDAPEQSSSGQLCPGHAPASTCHYMAQDALGKKFVATQDTSRLVG